MQWRRIIDITWADRKLAKNCASDKRGQRTFGADHWRLLKRRIASLEAAGTLEDMHGVPGHCHQLTADRAGTFAVSLWGSYRLLFSPDHGSPPLLPDGGLDRSRVTQIRLEEVIDYHGR